MNVHEAVAATLDRTRHVQATGKALRN